MFGTDGGDFSLENITLINTPKGRFTGGSIPLTRSE